MPRLCQSLVESMTKIESLHFREVKRPLRTLFATALGKKAFLRNVLVSVALDDGSIGVGEIPTSFSRKDETVSVIKQILEQVRTDVAGRPVDEYGEQVRSFRERFPHGRMTVSGVEVALFRALLNSTGRSEHAFFGGRANELETDITVPLVSDKKALAQWISYAMRRRFGIFKVKVGGDFQMDKRLLSLLCELIRRWERPFRLRLDGNQGFNVASCLRLMEFATREKYPVELFEQPLRKGDMAGLRKVTEGSPLPVILDESVESLSDARRVIDAGACHGINVKIAKSGIVESLEIMAAARKGGLKLMIGCMTETMVGLSTAIYCAAGSALFDYVDTDSIHLLHHRKSYGDIRIEGARFRITPQNPGCQDA